MSRVNSGIYGSGNRRGLCSFRRKASLSDLSESQAVRCVSHAAHLDDAASRESEYTRAAIPRVNSLLWAHQHNTEWSGVSGIASLLTLIAKGAGGKGRRRGDRREGGPDLH